MAINMVIFYNIKEMTGRRQSITNFLTFPIVDVHSGDTPRPPEQDGVGPQQLDLLLPDDNS
jgi:hypothetical protein